MLTKEEIKQKMQIEKEKRRLEMQKYWKKLKPFKNVFDIPLLPNPLTDFYIQKLIECGAIPKNKLKDGVKYLGKCRNASEAVWHENKNAFTYKRTKFMDTFDEDINHFEDDDGYDLFVPIMEVGEDGNRPIC